MAPYVSLTDQRTAFKLTLPPIADQREIAATLGALDDKIELNRKTAATLEEMARALYRSWFVDFDPVHARAEGRAPAHMDSGTAALFPDSFGEDGLPVGWHRNGLDEVADFLNGAALQKFPAMPDSASLPVIKIAELRNGLTANSGRASIGIPKKYLVENGDVLFSWSGSLLQKVWVEGPGALNQHLFKVTSLTVPKWFHFFAVDFHMEDFRIIAASKATTMGHIQRHHLAEAKVALPPSLVLVATDGLLRPIFDAAIQRHLENRTLATLRDSLLPRLMSGELRVGAARELIEDVA
ncbi:MAG: restriction endonuclease subunit S [Defluviimonas sp.]|nr:restriction endonuclease subunit S [Defluviimonas sp.]